MGASNILHTYVTGGSAQSNGGVTGCKVNGVKHGAQFYHFRSRIWGNSFNVVCNNGTTVSGQTHRLNVKVK